MKISQLFPKKVAQYLKDKCYWIIGGGTGYGRAISIALTAAKAKVFISGRRESRLLETQGLVELYGFNPNLCIPVVIDSTDELSVKTAVDSITAINKRLNGMIYTAALPQGNTHSGRPLHYESIEKWEKRFKTNVTGALLCTRYSSSIMLRSDSMRIILFSSTAGWAFTSGFGPYNITKAALNNLGASMAEEYSEAYPDKLVQINVIDPGEARTEMNQGSNDSPFAIIDIVGKLLSVKKNGPNGKFFHRDGRRLQFCRSIPYKHNL